MNDPFCCININYVIVLYVFIYQNTNEGERLTSISILLIEFLKSFTLFYLIYMQTLFKQCQHILN